MPTVDGIHEGCVYINLKTKDPYIVDGFCKCSETEGILVLYSRVGVACGGGTLHTQWAGPIKLFIEKFQEESEYKTPGQRR